MWIDRSRIREVLSHGPVVPVSSSCPSRSVLASLALVVMTVCLGTPPAVADLWYQHYQKAEEALEERLVDTSALAQRPIERAVELRHRFEQHAERVDPTVAAQRVDRFGTVGLLRHENILPLNS